MAALSITASEVQSGTTVKRTRAAAAVAVVAGQAVYRDPGTGGFKLAQCDGNADEAHLVGVAVNTAALGQTLEVQTEGDLFLGATAAPTVGQIYCLGTTAGTLVPYSDLATGNYVHIVGVGKTGNYLSLLPHNSLAIKP